MFTSTPPQAIASERDTHLAIYALALIKYAEQDKHFADNLAVEIQNKNWVSQVNSKKLEVSEYLIPTEEISAYRTAKWLFEQIETLPDDSQTKGLLSVWAQDRNFPKSLVLGIVGVAVIGPTLGIISKKKKRRSKLQIVIEDSYFNKLSKAEAIKITSELSQKVLSKEIRLANGNVYALHPDTAEWCMADPEVGIYTDTAENIINLKETATKESFSTETMELENKGVVAVAISPSVGDDFVEDTNADLVK